MSDSDSEFHTTSRNSYNHSTTYHTRWLPSDDQMLLDLVNSFTESSRIWKKVVSNMNGRTAVQCRTRWNYKHNPNRKRKCPDNDSEDGSRNSDTKRFSRKLDSLHLHDLHQPPKLTEDELLNIYLLIT